MLTSTDYTSATDRAQTSYLISYTMVLFVILTAVAPIRLMAATRTIDLGEAVELARLNDPWFASNRHMQEAVEARGVAAGSLPDPVVSLAMANLPIDTFDFNQEPMTQARVGVSQMFPRGDSLRLKEKQLQVRGSRFPLEREEREAKLTVMVAELWLDAYRAQESIALIVQNRPLFEQLADVAEASYSSALGRTRQQDIIRAQLELTRLDDRLAMLRQQQEMLIERLGEWLSDQYTEEYRPAPQAAIFSQVDSIRLGSLPKIKLLISADRLNSPLGDDELFDILSRHPAVKAIDRTIEAEEIGVDLARQNYKPAWGVNAAYGYREDADGGTERADFFTLGLTFDLPVFRKNRQDKQLAAALAEMNGAKTRKWSLLRKIQADFLKTRAQLFELNQRKHLYESLLLPQMHEQAEASLTAYTNDDGDFAEVVRARIAELNANIDALAINVDRLKAILGINYFLAEDPGKIITPVHQ